VDERVFHADCVNCSLIAHSLNFSLVLACSGCNGDAAKQFVLWFCGCACFGPSQLWMHVIFCHGPSQQRVLDSFPWNLHEPRFLQDAHATRTPLQKCAVSLHPNKHSAMVSPLLRPLHPYSAHQDSPLNTHGSHRHRTCTWSHKHTQAVKPLQS